MDLKKRKVPLLCQVCVTLGKVIGIWAFDRPHDFQ